MVTRREDDGPSSVDAFRAGDEAALAEVYERWSPLVYSLALRSLGDVGAAEDVTRRVFTQVWLARATYEPTRHRFSTWLVDLCRGIIAEARSGQGTTSRTGTTGPDQGDSGSMESKRGGLAERLLLADELAHLDATAREVLRLALDEDLSHTEIAGRTGRDVDEVKGLIASGLVELRRRWEVGADAHGS